MQATSLHVPLPHPTRPLIFLLSLRQPSLNTTHLTTLHSHTRRACLALILLVGILINAHSQIVKRERADGECPKIGLVLSGGGAKGLAHIGVLKAIERAGLHIDYIAGTSMGAIVAAMYASGYSADQIEKISRETHWMELINSRTRLADISIEDKDEFDNYTVSLPMKGFVPQINTGFFMPYQVMLRLQEVFYPVYKVTDFSQLDIPLRCIATDIATGNAVVLDRGDLAFATRSSMAIPGVFSATDYNGTKLVDGGIVRNFPVRDVIDMGADYVIGVNLFSGLTPAESINNMLDITLQITNFRDAADLTEEKAACDMIIEPDVSRYNAASFAAQDTILAIGDSIGVEFEPLFRQLADTLHNAFNVPYAPTQRMKPYFSQVRITGFEIDGLEKTNRKLLIHALDLHPGSHYTPEEFTEAIRRAMSTGYYNNLNYQLIPDGDVGNDVIFKCHVTENPMSFLKVALSYNTFTNASIFVDYQRRSLLGRLSTTDFKLAISKDFRFRFRNRTLFGVKDNHYIDFEFDHARFEVPTYDDPTITSNIYDYNHNDVSVLIGHASSAKSDIAFKLGWEHFHVSPDVGTADDRIEGHIHNLYASVTRRYNSLDRKFLSQSGVQHRASILVGGFPQYHLHKGHSLDSLRSQGLNDFKFFVRFNARFEFNQHLTEHFSLTEVLSGAASYADRAFVHQTALGGPHRHLPAHQEFYGLMTAHKYESTFLAARLTAQCNIFADLYLLAHLNSAVTFKSLDRYINDHQHFEPKEWLHGGGISLAYNLLDALPMDFTLMYSPDDKFNVHVNVGYFF